MSTDDAELPLKAHGYDEPATKDLLARRPLARAIAEIVGNTPGEFGVRVGLFGEWGSGKTSVLRFVREILEARDHTVVEFSPWGIADAAELWTRFAQRLLEQFEEKGKKPGSFFGRLLIKHHDLISSIGEVIKDAAARASPVGGVTPAIDAVRRIIARTQERVQEMAKGNERIVVMVDDVDRADPKLVPPILFALRELFDVQRFSWILAIDPVVVRAALKEHHPGFDQGRDFMEKIVDFTFTLSAPEPPDRVALLERDLGEHEIAAAPLAINEIASLLPDNPRELRSIVRHLRSLRPTLSRFGPADELDHRLVLLLVVLHAAAPNLLLRVLESRKLLQSLTVMRLSTGKGKKDPPQKAVRRLLEECGIRETDRPRLLEALLLHLGEGTFRAADTVIATGRLLHTPPVMTAGEAEKGLRDIADVSALRAWIARFAKEQDRTEPEVRRALFERLLASHSRAMEGAIGSYPDERVKRAVPSVIRIVRIVEWLLFDLKAVSELGGEGLERTQSSFLQWARFTHPPDYRPARQAERAALLRLANDADLEPLAALNRVAPIREMDVVDDEGDRAQQQLYTEVIDALEERATKALVDQLGREDFVESFNGWRRAGEYLLRSGGLIWNPKSRSQLREALERDNSAAPSDNARSLLAAAVERFEPSKQLPDHELVKLLWAAATRGAPNMRMFSTVEKLRKAVEALAQLKLDDPPWWAAKKEQFLAANVRTPTDTRD